MKTRLIKFAAASMIAGLLGVSSYAGSYNYDNSGYNTSPINYETTVMTSGNASFTGSVYIHNYGSVGAGIAEDAGTTDNEGILRCLCENVGPNSTASANNTGVDTLNPGGATYTLNEVWGGNPGDVYGSCSIGMTW